jgi:NADH dehydrogenase FAD-containing subunit
MSEALDISRPQQQTAAAMSSGAKRPQIVIVGGGFAGAGRIDRRRRRAPTANDVCFGRRGTDRRGIGGIDSSLRRNFRRIDPAATTIILLDGAKRILPSFAESLSKKAAKRLAKLGVQVVTDAMVEVIDDRGVIVGGKLIPCGAVLWTPGVSPSPLVKMLGVTTDRAGRACVGPFLTVPDTPNVFVIGDTATLMHDGKPLPGVAQVAIQQGRYVGLLIARKVRGRKAPPPFRHFDKGNTAVVGKNFTIMETRHIRLAGLSAWFAWAFIHLLFLPQLQKPASRRAAVDVELFHRAAQLASGHRGATVRQIAGSSLLRRRQRQRVQLPAHAAL